jgi:hypothetical protein
MNFEQAQIDILLWITGFVEKPHPHLNGWTPCPFARKARIDGGFAIHHGTLDPLSDLKNCTSIDPFTVVAYVYDPKEIDSTDFTNKIKTLNQDHLIKHNLIALADHPDEKEIINGVQMNQGTWAICFVQPLDKLNQHAKIIADKGYYTDWPEDYLKDLFEFREDPRLV